MGRIPKEQIALTTCNRCGCPKVGWFKSNRTGKPYMVNVEAELDRRGKLPKFGFAARNAFHNCEDYTRFVKANEEANRRAEQSEQEDAAAVPEILNPSMLVRENFQIEIDRTCSWPIYRLSYCFGKDSLGRWHGTYITCDTDKDAIQPVIESYLSGEKKMFLKYPKKEAQDKWKLSEAGEAYLMIFVAPERAKAARERRAARIQQQEEND